MNAWLDAIFGGSPTQPLPELAGNAKALFMAISGLLTVVTNKFIAPFQDDMPFPLKLLLIALVVAEAFVLPTLHLSRNETILWSLGIGVAALLVYLICYWLWGYKKVVEVPRRFLRRGGYKEVTILGGLRLLPEAQRHTGGDTAKVQTFLADNQYNRDAVWSRASRLPVQIVAVLSYSIAICSLTGVLFAAATV